MQATDTSAIQRLIGKARSRIRLQWALEGATSGLILATANALIAIWLLRMERVGEGTGIALLVASAVFVIGGALISALRPLDDEMLARKIDRASNLSDRLSTAIAFQRALATGQHASAEDAAETEDLMVAAIKDGVRAAPRANVAAATPFTAPRDLKAAGGFLVLAALVAGLAIERPDRLPGVHGVDPEQARPGETIHLRGKNLLTGISAPVASLQNVNALIGAPDAGSVNGVARGFVPTDGSVQLGVGADARPLQVLDWTKTQIAVVVPEDAKPGDTSLTVFIGKKALGPIAFRVLALNDSEHFKKDSVIIDADERAYIEAILNQLKAVAQRDNVPELEEFAQKLEQLLKDAEQGKITKEQLLEALQKAEEALSSKSEPNQAEINKAMSEMGKELAKENITKELGEALQKNDLQKAKEELEKLAQKLDPEQAKKDLEELKKQLENKDLTEEQKKDLAKKIDDLKKQLEDKNLTEQQKKDLEKQIEDLKKQLDKQDLTEQQKKDLEKKLEDAQKKLENKDLTPEQKEQLKQQLQDLQKQMQNKDLTEKQKEELQKQIQQLSKDQKPMTEQDKQKLQQKLEQVAKQMDQKDQKDQQQQTQQQQKLEKQIRELQKKKDEAKNEKEQQEAERELNKKKDELEKLKKDQDQKNQSAQREALKRLQKDMEKAAENLEKKPEDKNKSKDERDEEEKERDRQASQKLKDAARETGRVDKDQRKQTAQQKMSSQMDDLREAMRRAKQKGNKGPDDPFNKGNKNKDFGQRARGQKGSGQAWKPGQGQGQGQGQGKPGQGQPGGQGQQPGGKQWGTGTGGDMAGDPTQKSGDTKDTDLKGVSGSKGTSRRETILAAAQKGFASTSYQKVYADYQRIVEEVMRNEKLPSSYKYYVKRYFAKIHPNTGTSETAPAPTEDNK